jgi:hypothetical protein
MAEQFDTERDFDGLADCVVTTMPLQGDHEEDRAGTTSGRIASDLKSDSPQRERGEHREKERRYCRQIRMRRHAQR